MSNPPIYKITFHNNGFTYVLFAKECTQGNMFAFVEVGDFVFDNTTSLVVDPSQEKLKSEFGNVRRTYIPIQSIIRIDEVNEVGEARIEEHMKSDNNVHPFPIIPPKK